MEKNDTSANRFERLNAGLLALSIVLGLAALAGCTVSAADLFEINSVVDHADEQVLNGMATL